MYKLLFVSLKQVLRIIVKWFSLLLNTPLDYGVTQVATAAKKTAVDQNVEAARHAVAARLKGDTNHAVYPQDEEVSAHRRYIDVRQNSHPFLYFAGTSGGNF